MASTDLTLLETLLQDWRELLSLWAANGTLSRAAQHALQLDGEPEKLSQLVREWSQGDFRNLPPVVLLPSSDMPGAVGAYAISTGTIYLNQDWLASANKDRVIGVFTEELGHHLDGLLNTSDTPGDEGELFSLKLIAHNDDPSHIERIRIENDHSFLHAGGVATDVETASLWTRPIGAATITQTFDTISFDYNKDGVINEFDKHKAIDFAAPLGSPIYASRSGTVQLFPDNGGAYGNRVVINHGDGFSSVYAHLSKFSVPSGSSVLQGQKIGEVGSTGFSTGNHLHFEILSGSTKLDPLPLVNGTTPPIVAPPPSTDNRVVLPIFEPAYYLATYADVRNAYGATNHDGAKSHWLEFGIKEGRRGSLVFDPKGYLQRYQDVANAYGATNYAGAISHWLEWGLKYGRRGSQEFDPIYYMAAHPDVEAAYGVMNFSGAISHYYQWGKPGGWYGSEWITDQNAFQLGYYLNNNADVKAVTANANQEVEATRHWYFIGINEGRRGSAEFDSKFYLANNPDVRAAYGDGNYRGAIDHYLLFGKPTGRAGANDTPRNLSISDASISEGNNGARELSFVVSLNIVSGETVTVNFNTSNGTAASGSDYSGTSGSLSFSPGETSKSVVVQIIGDSTHEGDEIFYVNLSGASNAAITRSQGVGTIFNDDPANNAPTGLGVSVNSFNENIAPGSTVATLATTDPDAGNTFSYGLVSGTGDTDNNAFSIAGNQLSIKASPDFESKNSYSIRVRSTDQGGLSFERAVIFNVIDVNEPVITLSISPTSVTEDGTSKLVYTFSRTGATTTALTVNYTVGGTATLGTDYTGISATPAVKTVIFAANSSTATVTVDPTADTTIEANETVALTLATGTGYSIGTTAAVVGTILNDDVPLITLAVSPTAGVAEDGTSNLVYTFSRTGATTTALTVNYTVAGTATLGTDYTGIAATPAVKTVTFASNSATATVTVDPTADTTIEANETVALTLATGTGYTIGTTAAVVGTILNDDVPVITLAVAPTTGVSEDGTSNLIYTFSRTGATTTALTVNYTVAGSATLGTDYTGIAATPAVKTLTFAANSSTATVTVDPTADTTIEANETVELTLATGTGYTIGTTAAVVGTILNDDVPVITLAVAPTTGVSEDGTSNLIYTFSRTGATTTALTVNYTVAGSATLGTDYTGIAATPAVKTLTFAANSSTATVTVDPTADTTIEANETVELTLATGTGYTIGTTAAVVGTILNDDVPVITLAVAPTTGVSEDGTSNLVYTFSRTGATTTALTVNYTVAGSATLGTDYTGIAATPAVKTLTFAANSSTATVTVDPTADTTIEANETVELTLATGTGYTIGTSSAVVGTILNDDVSSTGTYSMGASESSLLLLGTKRINGLGNNLNNTIAGNSGNNRILGLLGADVLTGGGSADSDLFAYNTLSESLLGTGNSFDIITDFNNKDRLLAPLSVETDRLVGSIGNIASLSASTIATLLNSTTFAANSVAAFTATGRTGTFIAMNDSRDGYQPESDAVLFLQNYAVSPANYVDFA
ncbi:peptidoglycan DD-metalloendopeptidase family protein [Cyanobium sp. Cruz CV11-17]|nr:peptidoglycan DD-metalloendopeptidase family protein [Cyanobium sp. Cruz CV11-17]